MEKPPAPAWGLFVFLAQLEAESTERLYRRGAECAEREIETLPGREKDSQMRQIQAKFCGSIPGPPPLL